MENEKKVSFQLLVLIATPKLADRAAEMFRKGALPCNTAFMQKEQLQARLWMYLDLETLIKVFSSV